MSESPKARSKRGSAPRPKKTPDANNTTPQRTSRRLAGARPEVEVIKRSRGLNSPTLDSSRTSLMDQSIGTPLNLSMFEEANAGADDQENGDLSSGVPAFELDAVYSSSHHTSAMDGNKSNSAVDTFIVIDDPEDSHSYIEAMDVDHIPSASAFQLPLEERSSEPLSSRSSTRAASSSHTGSSTPSSDTDSLDYWNRYVGASGLRRIRLLVGTPGDSSPSTQSSAAVFFDEELYSMMDEGRPASTSSNGKRKKAKPKPVVEEEIVFTEQDLLEKQIRERSNDLEGLRDLHHTISRLNSSLSDSNRSLVPRAVSRAFSDLLDEIIVDLIEETHHSILTHPGDENQGVLRNERGVDIYGQEAASIRTDSFLCGNMCGRVVSSNRYAPHLEKCTGMQGATKSKPRRSHD